MGINIQIVIFYVGDVKLCNKHKNQVPKCIVLGPPFNVRINHFGAINAKISRLGHISTAKLFWEPLFLVDRKVKGSFKENKTKN